MSLHVLFVDDEREILDAFSARVRLDRAAEVTCATAIDANAALAALSARPADVVVTDMRMPGMDGAALLGEVRRRWPDTIRIVLSGHMDRTTMSRALPVAHLVLSKPCAYEELKPHLERARSVRGQIRETTIGRAFARIDALPTAPDIYLALSDAMTDPRASVARIATIVDKDPAITAKVLQLANSACFFLPRRVVTTSDALHLIGLDLLRKLVLSAEVFQVFGRHRLPPGLDVAAMQRHAFVVANLAGSLRPGDDHASAVTAGLLHDVGTLALAAALPDAMAELLRGPPATPDVMLAAERARLGCTHADAGAFLLELWGLPLDIIHAVGAHEDNLRGRLSRIDLPTAVGLANRVAELTAAVHGSATDTREALAQAFPSLPDAEHDRLALLAAHAWRETAPIPSPGAPA